MPNTINLVDYKTPCNPGHIKGEQKDPCFLIGSLHENYMVPCSDLNHF